MVTLAKPAFHYGTACATAYLTTDARHIIYKARRGLWVVQRWNDTERKSEGEPLHYRSTVAEATKALEE